MSLSNYPPGVSDSTWDAPWTEPSIPEKDFEITCSQSLSKTVTVTTDNYVPGASGCDYEPDGEGGYCASSWHDDDDTSYTCWDDEYSFNGHKTPLELIAMLKEYLEQDLRKWEEEDKKDPHKWAATQVRKYKSLIEECEGWVVDDLEFVEE